MVASAAWIEYWLLPLCWYLGYMRQLGFTDMHPAAYNYGGSTGDRLGMEGFQETLSNINEEWIITGIDLLLPDHVQLIAQNIDSGNVPEPYYSAIMNLFLRSRAGPA